MVWFYNPQPLGPRHEPSCSGDSAPWFPHHPDPSEIFPFLLQTEEQKLKMWQTAAVCYDRMAQIFRCLIYDRRGLASERSSKPCCCARDMMSCTSLSDSLPSWAVVLNEAKTSFLRCAAKQKSIFTTFPSGLIEIYTFNSRRRHHLIVLSASRCTEQNYNVGYHIVCLELSTGRHRAGSKARFQIQSTWHRAGRGNLKPQLETGELLRGLNYKKWFGP